MCATAAENLDEIGDQPMASQLQKPEGAYPAEWFYSTTPLTAKHLQVELDAHDLLDYARARMEVANGLEADFEEEPSTGVIGFLTGSIGILATARELLEPSYRGRFRFVPGLTHFGLKLEDSEQVFHSVLKDLCSCGVHRIVLVDEIKSGTQLKTELRSALRWVHSSGAEDLQISVIGVHGMPTGGKQSPPTACQIVEVIGASSCIINPRTIATRTLLEMDREGLRFRGVMRTQYAGGYDFYREQPSGGLLVRCPSGGAHGGVGVTSLDTAFGGLVRRILRPSMITAAEPFDAGDEPSAVSIEPLESWPDLVFHASCEECRRLLRAARALARLH